MSFVIQRVYEGAGEDGEDIYETLARGFADPDAALKHLKDQFKSNPEDDEIDVTATYNAKTKRFSIIPVDREDLLFHIVKLSEIDEIEKDDGFVRIQ